MRFLLRPLLAAALLAAPAAAQTTPDALAAQLQAAARAGDAAAYRALTAGSGTFPVEVANFAADLARVPQPTVTYTVSDVAVSGAAARARMTVAWERVPGRVTRVSFPAALERRGDVWRYAGEALAELPAAPSRLWAVDDGSLPARASWLAPLIGRAAGHVTELLGVPVPVGAAVKVYPDMAALSASVNLTLQPVGGWNEPGEAIKLVLPSGPDAEREALRVLAHEFTHLGVSAAVREGPSRRVPWWLHEGLADAAARAHWSPEAARARQERVTGYAKAGWVPLDELRDFTAVPEDRWRYVYAQGLGVVDFLTARAPGAPLALARAFADTGQPDTAAGAVGFASFAALEAAARAWLAAR